MKKVIKKVVVGVSCLTLISIGLAGCANNQDKTQNTVATIDYEIVMKNNPDVQKAQDTMKQEYEKIRDNLQTSTDNPQAKQDQMMEAQKNIQQKQKELFAPIKTSVDKSIDSVVKEKGLSTVFEKRAVVHGGTDITKDVLIKEGISPENAQKILDEREDF